MIFVKPTIILQITQWELRCLAVLPCVLWRVYWWATYLSRAPALRTRHSIESIDPLVLCTLLSSLPPERSWFDDENVDRACMELVGDHNALSSCCCCFSPVIDRTNVWGQPTANWIRSHQGSHNHLVGRYVEYKSDHVSSVLERYRLSGCYRHHKCGTLNYCNCTALPSRSFNTVGLPEMARAAGTVGIPVLSSDDPAYFVSATYNNQKGFLLAYSHSCDFQYALELPAGGSLSPIILADNSLVLGIGNQIQVIANSSDPIGGVPIWNITR